VRWAQKNHVIRANPLETLKLLGMLEVGYFENTAVGIEKISLVLCKQHLFVYSQRTRNESQHLVMLNAGLIRGP